VNVSTEREPDQQTPAKLRDDAKFAAGKIAFFQYLTVAIFLFLVAGFWDLQVRNPAFYSELAEQNSIRSIPVLAPRGKILDRDGRVIVDNHASFSVYLSRENLKWEHLKAIADGLNLDYNDLLQKIHRFDGQPQYVPVIIKEELTPEDLAFVEAHRDPREFPELGLIQAERRLYPKDGFAAHVVGYVGEVSDAELDNPDFLKYHPGDVIGKAGLERQYNDSLMGVDGQKRVMVDSMGHEVGQPISDKEATPGTALQTTLDLDLQSVAELGLGDRPGAVVALDPRSGEILAMVSHPSYDPNLFTGRLTNKDWQDLVNNPLHPLLDRAIQAQLAPGSTFNRSWRWRACRRASSTTTSKCIAAEGRVFTATGMPAGENTATEPLASTRRSSNPAMYFSTRWATSWGSIASRSMRSLRASGTRRASICRRKRQARCRRPPGNGGTSVRNGLPARRFRWRSDRARLQ